MIVLVLAGAMALVFWACGWLYLRASRELVNGVVTEPSSCDGCGRPARWIHNGVPVCGTSCSTAVGL